MRQSIGLGFVVLAVSLAAASCGVMVDPESLAVRCAIDPAMPSAPDPCLELGQQQCVDGTCRPCDVDAHELCNGRDDDCDGKIDEGHDEDHDGFTWCGGAVRELADCVDSDGKIHPAPLGEDGSRGRAPEEVCDGKDNDCDSRVDENRACGTTKKCTETGCPENQTCDAETGVCIVPRPVGSGCTNDSDCKDGFCLSPGSFGLPVALMDSRCARACCSDADCNEGNGADRMMYVCVIADSGARACLPKNIVGGGAKKAQEACTRDSECASGVCARVGTRGLCQTRCFRPSDCSNAACILSAGDAAETRIFWCGEPVGRIPSGDACTFGPSCQTNLCTLEQVCAAACARDSDCGEDSYCKSSEVPAGPIIGIGPPASPISICAHKPAATAEAEQIPHLCCTNADCAGRLCAPDSPRAGQWHMSCR